VKPPSNDYTHILALCERVPRHYTKSVTVVVAHYNSRILLERCLAGITQQTYPASLIELVVSDDGSDELLTGVQEMFRGVLDVRIITQPHHGFRLATVRNRGLFEASGEVIIFMDCDIIPVPEFVEAHMRWFHASNQVATVGPRKFIDTTGIDPRSIPQLLTQLRLGPDVASISNRSEPLDRRLPIFRRFWSCTHPYNWFYGCNIAVRRAAAIEIGGFDENFNGAWGYEDIEFGYRLFSQGTFLVAEQGALALHQESAGMSGQQRQRDGEINRRRLYREIPELAVYRMTLGLP